MFNLLQKSQNIFTEENFRKKLPIELISHADNFFTPIDVAQKAAEWFEAGKCKQVLDIGAGVGKFCIAASLHSEKTFFTGIEYRMSLADTANKLIKYFGIKNTFIHHKNITNVDFSEYDGFYFYNPFLENLMPSIKLNDEIRLDAQCYFEYSDYTFFQLHNLKKGAMLVTYYNDFFALPRGFTLVDSAFNNNLKLWIKR